MAIVRADRPHAVRRQLRGLSWHRTPGRQGVSRISTTASWLWGGDPESIAETIRVGINSAHPESRTSQMLAFGRDQMLQERRDRRRRRPTCAAFPIPTVGETCPRRRSTAGKAVFAANCVACHGDDAKGNAELGAPDLTDRLLDLWRRRRVDLSTPSGAAGRATCRPGTEGSPPLDRKILALYLFDLAPERTMSSDRRSDAADPDQGRRLARDRRRAVAAADCQRAPRLCGHDIAAGLRRACAPGRGRPAGTASSARHDRHARRDEPGRETNDDVDTGRCSTSAARADHWNRDTSLPRPLSTGSRPAGATSRPIRRPASATALLVFLVSVVIVVGLFALGWDYILLPGVCRVSWSSARSSAIGLYEKSRRIAEGEPVSLCAA